MKLKFLRFPKLQVWRMEMSHNLILFHRSHRPPHGSSKPVTKFMPGHSVCILCGYLGSSHMPWESSCTRSKQPTEFITIKISSTSATRQSKKWTPQFRLRNQ